MRAVGAHRLGRLERADNGHAVEDSEGRVQDAEVVIPDDRHELILNRREEPGQQEPACRIESQGERLAARVGGTDVGEDRAAAAEQVVERAISVVPDRHHADGRGDRIAAGSRHDDPSEAVDGNAAPRAAIHSGYDAASTAERRVEAAVLVDASQRKLKRGTAVARDEDAATLVDHDGIRALERRASPPAAVECGFVIQAPRPAWTIHGSRID